MTPNPTPARIEIRGLHKTYRAEKILPLSKERPMGGVGKALNGVDLDITEGENTGIVGESGCGKTTLCKLIVNMLNPDPGGAITFVHDGRRFGWSRVPLRQRRAFRNRLQYVFQHPGDVLSPLAPAGAQVSEGLFAYLALRLGPIHALARKLRLWRNLLLHGGETLPEVHELMIEDLELDEEQINSAPIELSGGEQKRVLLAKSYAALGKLSSATLRRAASLFLGLTPPESPAQLRQAARVLALIEPEYLRAAVAEELAHAIEERNAIDPAGPLSSASGLFNWPPNQAAAETQALKKTGLPLRRAIRQAPPESLVAQRVQTILDEISARLAQSHPQKVRPFPFPKFLILDEPMRGIDSVNKLRIVRDLQQLRGAATLLVITHDIHILQPLCDRVIVMHAGLIQEQAPIRALPLSPAATPAAFDHIHPYTAALIHGELPPAQRILGQTPGCPFQTCCAALLRNEVSPETRAQCLTSPPPLFPTPDDPTHLIRCWRHAPPPAT